MWVTRRSLVTRLRKMMLEELQRRNLSKLTAECYLRAVEEFALFYKRPPDQLGRNRSDSTRHTCLPTGNWTPTRSHNIFRLSGSSSSRPLSGIGALRRHPIPND